jgi:hypothetical protein
MQRLIALFLLTTAFALGQRPDRPRHYVGVVKPLTDPGFGQPEEIGRRYLHSIAPELSLTAADLDSLYVAKQYRTEHNGVTHLVFRQRFRDIEVGNAEWVVNLDRDGRVLNAGGDLYSAPESKWQIPSRTRAFSAVRSAVAAVDPESADRFAPFETAGPLRSPSHVRFARGPLAREPEGSPVWFAQRGTLRPAWKFHIAAADAVHAYSVTVDDESQTVLDRQSLTFFQSAAGSIPPTPRGWVFDQESPQPNPTPGVRVSAPPPIVPRVLKGFQGDPVASPLGWTDGRETAGNNVIAGLNLLGANLAAPARVAGVNSEFNFPLQLGPGFHPLNYPGAAVTNVFYWINRAHDLFYQYGFDEQAGNFQMNNFGRGGVGGDPVLAYSHFGAQAAGQGAYQDAYFMIFGGTDDGFQPQITMYVSGGGGATNGIWSDTSYDSQLMLHEYTHGVAFRLVRQLSDTYQGASMAEGWGDFYALEFTTPDGAPANGTYSPFQYSVQSWGPGIARMRPYSTDLNVNPITYADLGKISIYPEVHDDGEIWAAALWGARARLIAQLGEAEGRKRMRQLVMDGMKLAVPAPHMVEMRDAILLADRVDYQGASQEQLWAAFAERGLGALAFSDGGDTVHVVPSFDLPSTTGQLKFYDDPIVIGEPVRVILQDSNYTQATAVIQLTASSGDLENVVLRQHGAVYEGILATGQSAAAQQSGRLNLSSGDRITASYLDARTGAGFAKKIEAVISTMMPYAASSSAAAFTFSGERRVSVPTGSFTIQKLPFSFPFFDKVYGSAIVYANGMIAFEFPAATGTCSDSLNLMRYRGMTPLWLANAAASLSGTAQANEGLYISTTPDSITFRFAGEYAGVGQYPSPTNYAATLFSDGRVEFSYGSGNQTVNSSANHNECGAPVYGLGNGHDVYAMAAASGNFTNHTVVRFDPPFHSGSVPTATIAAPRNGDRVQDILMVNGTASDSQLSVVALDVLVDGVNRAHLVPSGSPLRWSTALNLAALGLQPGSHTLKVRVTNSRGAFADLPEDKPVTFTMEPGAAFPPVVVIESPADGDTIAGNLAVKGYAYNNSLRITGVDTLIDGFVYGPTTYGATRSEICGPLSPAPPNCSAIGFTASIRTADGYPPVPEGSHTLQLRVRDQTGRMILYPATPMRITVRNGAPVPVIGVLESPLPNSTLSGSVTLSGYVYSPKQTITEAIVLVGGMMIIGNVKLGVPRPDLCPSLPDADACPAIGFTYTFDTTRLLNGTHVIGIEGVNARGDRAIFPSQNGYGMTVFVRN